MVLPGNALRPASISYSTQPNAQISVRLSTACPRACSGLIYAGVPTIVPTCMSIDVMVGSGDRHAGFRLARRTLRKLVCQRRPFDELHNERAEAVRFFETVDRRDVRMIQRREQPRLARKPREPIGVAGKVGWEELDRDVAPELRIAGAIHLPHSAGAERRHDLVRSDAGSWEKGH